METHIHSKGHTGFVGVKHGDTHSLKRTYLLRWSKAKRRKFTQKDIQASLESSMETHIHSKEHTRLIGVQHGDTPSLKRTYRLRRSAAWRHTFTQKDIHASLESSMETHFHSKGHKRFVAVQHGDTHYSKEHTGFVGVKHGDTLSFKKTYRLRWSKA